ncbi:MAG TPA: FapA family protein, partial [Spirochaetota bacterium]|nr:FapA family protein [Spirochaetota bacterium]
FRGTIDMTDVVAIGRAVKGMPLLQLKPAISGRNGMTVRGEEIKAADVKSLQIETRRNTKRAGDLIVPELDGIVYLYDSAILVKAYADAEVQIELDDEKMNAFVNLIPSVGDGLKLDMGIAREALTKAGITNGVNERMLEDAITKCEADKMPFPASPSPGEPSRSTARTAKSCSRSACRAPTNRSRKMAAVSITAKKIRSSTSTRIP